MHKCRTTAPVKVRNISGSHQIDRLVEFNPFPNIQPKKLAFYIFDFHPYFDGLIGYEALRQLRAEILTGSNQLKIGNTKINMLKKYPSSTRIQLNAHETKPVEVQVCKDNGDFLIPENKSLQEKFIIHSGLYNAHNSKATIMISNSTDVPLEIKLLAEDIEINNYETAHSPPTQCNTDRSELLEQLRLDHLNCEEKKHLVKLICQYQPIFHLKPNKLSFTNAVKHKIETQDDMPIHSKSYRYPYHLREEVQKQIRELLEQGIIRPSSSPWSSPIWVVPKKADASGLRKWRLVVDYRKLNVKTTDDKYPLPNITEVLDKLGRCNYFTTLDLASGFHQIEVEPKDIPKTAFSVDHGKYEYVRMPFGLKNAPSTFQRVMDNVLRELIGTVCLVYMDDIIIFSASLQEHLVNLKKVFDALQKYNLQVQLDKSEFLRKEVAFLGHVVTSEGVKPNPDKIIAIKNWPLPKSETELRGFLGTIGYYRRFIRDFAKIVKPLTTQLRKGEKIRHCDDFVMAFNKCKTLLTSSHVLQYPDFSKPFVLTTDASNFAIGAVLSQGPIGKDRPVAFASRTLTKTEEKYSVIEKELLAIAWACKYFRPYLFGKKFTLFTDHKPLTYMFSLKDPNDKMIRWRLRLEEFDYEVKYRPGKQNVVADGLSRIKTNEINANELDASSDDATCHSADTDDSEFIEMTLQPINHFSNQIIFQTGVEDKTEYDQIFPHVHRRIITRTSFTVARMYNIFKEYMDPKRVNCVMCDESLINTLQIVFRNYFSRCKTFKIKISQKLLTDLRTAEDQNRVIAEIHNRAHRGIQENLAQLGRTYYFPNMKKSIRKFVILCETCQNEKYERHPYKTTLAETPIPTSPLEIVHVDIFICQPNIFLTAVDKLSKYATLIPIKSRSIPDVRSGLTKLISTLGLPKLIVCDNEPALKSIEVRGMLHDSGVEMYFTPSNKSEVNGIVERFHSTLSEIYRCIQTKHEELSQKERFRLSIAYYNNTIHSSTGLKPKEIFFGLKDGDQRPMDAARITENSKRVYDEAVVALRKKQTQDLQFHNRGKEPEPTLEPGETVHVARQGIKSKTKAKFKPYKVIRDYRKTFQDNLGRKVHKSKIRRKRKL